MQFSSILDELGTYPFVELDTAKREAMAAGRRLIDFGIGEPREPVEPFIREALIAGVDETHGYPRSIGLAELREAVSKWCHDRFGIPLDPDHEIVPTLGSKEAIFSFAQVVVDPGAGKDLVITTEPAYPIADRGARFAGAQVARLPLRAATGFLPDLDAVGAKTWSRAALVWLNYPNNPTAAVATLELYENLCTLAAEHDFVVASDEAYSEIYFDAPPISALQCVDRSRVAVFNSLSKRSSMAGYRSGFIAASPTIMAAVRAFRTDAGRDSAGVCSASGDCRVAGRGARRANARALPGEARSLARRFHCSRSPGRRGCRNDVPLGRDRARRDVGRPGTAPARRWRDRDAGLRPRPVRRGLRASGSGSDAC